VRFRYWGKEKQIFPTLALLELVSNDYPEQCFNMGITQNGNYTKPFGHSCLYDKVSMPYVHAVSFIGSMQKMLRMVGKG
jgi:hypothetical protein